MNFDDREKKLDRKVNKFFVHFRKFQEEITCPACNISPNLKKIRNIYYDSKEKKLLRKKWIHNSDECFRWYSGMVLSTAKNKKGKYFSNNYLQNIIEIGLKNLKELDKEYTKRGT